MITDPVDPSVAQGPPAGAPPDEPPGGLAGRWALTLLLPAFAYALTHVDLPGVDSAGLRRLTPDRPIDAVSVGALGLTPVLSAFYLVEVAALLVPRWRPLRWGAPEDRRRLTRAACALALLLSLAQSFFIARFLEANASTFAGFRVVHGQGPLFELITMLTLTASVCALVGLAWLVDRFGLSGGVALLLGWEALWRAAQSSGGLSRGASGLPRSPLGPLLALAAVAAATVALLRRRSGTLRLPTCGVVPVHAALSLLVLPLTLVGWLPDLAGLLPLAEPGTLQHLLGALILSGALALLLALLFNRPADVGRVVAACSGGAATVESAEVAAEGALRRGTALSLAYLALLCLAVYCLGDAATLAPLQVAVGAAVVLDVLAEARARRRLGPLLPVWTLPAVHAAAPVAEALARAGIPCHVRGVHYRALLHFFGPFAPIALLVPAADAGGADALLRELWPGVVPRTPAPGRLRWRFPLTPGAALAALALLLLVPQLRRVKGWLARPVVRLVYRVAPEAPLTEPQRRELLARTVEVLAQRLDNLGVAGARVASAADAGGDVLRVDLPALDRDRLRRTRDALGRPGRLEFKRVDDGSEYMQRLGAYADSRREWYAGLEVGYDAWTARDSGLQHADVYLRAPAADTLRKVLRELPPEHQPPADHELALERTQRRDDAGAPTQEVVWRTHYLHRRAELSGESIADADVHYEPNTDRPEVSLAFDREGARRFAELTGANVGGRLAIMLEGQVSSAPTIESRIAGGRARITLGAAADPIAAEQEARDLMAILRVGVLPLPLSYAGEEALDGEGARTAP